MRAGILVSSIGNFGQKGFYNAQEVGLAKALAGFCEEVIVYKLVDKSQQERSELIEEGKNATIHFIPSQNLGINGWVDTSILDKNLDFIIYFSDTQFSVHRVWKWAIKNRVKFYPYIGVLESHSDNLFKRMIVNFMAERNFRIYRKCTCLAKTPEVKGKLEYLGVKQVQVAPVGLDLSILKKNYELFDIDELKEKYGYTSKDKILLYIGRMTREKRPMKLIELFHSMQKIDSSYRLLMVGNGELKGEVEECIQKFDMDKQIKMIEKIPNEDIWELYRIADSFINLNQQEIFGMAILEAMYYGCKVVAWKAPGPVFIIEDRINGCIVEDEKELLDAVFNVKISAEKCKKRILEKFTWDSFSGIIMKINAGDQSVK